MLRTRVQAYEPNPRRRTQKIQSFEFSSMIDFLLIVAVFAVIAVTEPAFLIVRSV